MKKYIFKKYDEKYPRLFQKEKAKLKKVLPKNVKIEHIGSTAIKGLGGKGIIDIAISINKKGLGKAKDILENNSYEFRPKGGNKNRLFFKKIYKYAEKEKIVHLHLIPHNSKDWKKDIAFRDHLRKDKKLLKKYEEIKKKAVKHAKEEGKKYRGYKNKFFKKIKWWKTKKDII